MVYSITQLNTDRTGRVGEQEIEQDEPVLDRAFLALADPIRRRMIARLSRGPATVNELAEPFSITVQAVSKHIQVLETAGLVTRTKDAQRRPVHLEPATLEQLTGWIDHYRLDHERRFRRLDTLLASTSTPTPTRPTPPHHLSAEEQES